MDEREKDTKEQRRGGGEGLGISAQTGTDPRSPVLAQVDLPAHYVSLIAARKFDNCSVGNRGAFAIGITIVVMIGGL